MSAAVSIHCCERSASRAGEGEAGIAAGRAHQRAHRGLVRGQHFDPAHQHVEQPLARRLLGHVGIARRRAPRGRSAFTCAARIASVEPNAPRSSESETPAPFAISAKPICSIGFSASSAMKASMMRSRSDSLRRCGARRVAGFDFGICAP
jgi:hypothetical protein